MNTNQRSVPPRIPSPYLQTQLQTYTQQMQQSLNANCTHDKVKQTLNAFTHASSRLHTTPVSDVLASLSNQLRSVHVRPCRAGPGAVQQTDGLSAAPPQAPMSTFQQQLLELLNKDESAVILLGTT